jgi:hypothetical protein
MIKGNKKLAFAEKSFKKIRKRAKKIEVKQKWFFAFSKTFHIYPCFLFIKHFWYKQKIVQKLETKRFFIV